MPCRVHRYSLPTCNNNFLDPYRWVLYRETNRHDGGLRENSASTKKENAPQSPTMPNEHAVRLEDALPECWLEKRPIAEGGNRGQIRYWHSRSVVRQHIAAKGREASGWVDHPIRNQAILLVLLHTALRVSEVLSLDLAHYTRTNIWSTSAGRGKL